MENEYLNILKELIREAGEIALRYREDSSPSFKADRSIVTKADKEISMLFRQRLKDLLSRPGHILIDEEDEKNAVQLTEQVLHNAKYIFAIDPIDGTRIYANRMPGFGISAGVLKDRKPWLGIVYFPVLGELFYSDGENSHFVQNAFTSQEIQRKIVPVDQLINKQTLFLLPDAYFNRFDWDFKDCHVIIPACAVVDLCWPAIGRGCGSLVRSYLWDFAGSWPIVRSAGMEFRNLETGEALEQLSIEHFNTDKTPWKLKDFYLISSARNFPILQKKITLREERKT